MRLVYLDNAATSQKPRQVIDELRRFYAEDNSLSAELVKPKTQGFELFFHPFLHLFAWILMKS